MRILIVGDMHGRHQKLAEVLWQAQVDYRIAVAIQVGDFGFVRDVMTTSGPQKTRYPVPLHVIDGNHEDHHWLQHALRAGAAKVWKNEANLIYQPRPSVACFGASTVGFMGGALHVDRPQSHNLISGFPNYILRHQREHASALFNREQPELIVTHSCPSRIGIGLHGTAEQEHNIAEHILAEGFDPGPQDDCGEEELRLLWKDLGYRPRNWVFGHFHRVHRITIEGTQFVCVNDDLDSHRRTLMIWDTEEKKLLMCPADPSAEPSPNSVKS